MKAETCSFKRTRRVCRGVFNAGWRLLVLKERRESFSSTPNLFLQRVPDVCLALFVLIQNPRDELSQRWEDNERLSCQGSDSVSHPGLRSGLSAQIMLPFAFFLRDSANASANAAAQNPGAHACVAFFSLPQHLRPKGAARSFFFFFPSPDGVGTPARAQVAALRRCWG